MRFWTDSSVIGCVGVNQLEAKFAEKEHVYTAYTLKHATDASRKGNGGEEDRVRKREREGERETLLKLRRKIIKCVCIFCIFSGRRINQTGTESKYIYSSIFIFYRFIFSSISLPQNHCQRTLVRHQ